MNEVFYRNTNLPPSDEELRTLTQTEWLVTNGLGGYASGTVGGTLTRVFHGYLISALPSPLGRTMMLNDILEEAIFPDGRSVLLNGLHTEAGDESERAKFISRFRLDAGLPVWTYEFEGISLEKRLVMPHRQNTVYITYHLTYGSKPIKLRLRPAVNMREHEAPVNTPLEPYTLTVHDHQYELKAEGVIPPLRFNLHGNGQCLFD